MELRDATRPKSDPRTIGHSAPAIPLERQRSDVNVLHYLVRGQGLL